MAKKNKTKPESTQKSAAKSPQAGPDLGSLGKLFELLKKHDVCEFEWEDSSSAVRLKTQGAFNTPVIAMPSSTGGGPRVGGTDSSAREDELLSAVLSPRGSIATGSTGNSKKAESKPSNQRQVLSPFVGTFYRAGSPTAEPYVVEGQMIKKGQPLCIIEAMKLMNEIESEVSGKIISVIAENGQPVEFGEPLFLIEE